MPEKKKYFMFLNVCVSHDVHLPLYGFTVILYHEKSMKHWHTFVYLLTSGYKVV